MMLKSLMILMIGVMLSTVSFGNDSPLRELLEKAKQNDGKAGRSLLKWT